MSESSHQERLDPAPSRDPAPLEAVGPATDLVLEYSLIGDPPAPVVLFLHGITGSRHYFFKKVRSLARHYRLLLADLPGFGESPKPRTAYTIDFYRQTVRNTIMAAGCENDPIHIVGHSLGALIAVDYAVHHSDHVRRMVLLGLPRFEDSRVAHESFWKGSPNYRRLLNEHSMAENVAQWRRTGLPMMVSYIFRFPFAVIRDSRKFTLNSLTSTLENCLINYRVDPLLARMEPRPVLMIHGRRDQVAPFDNIACL
ncbi:MAG: alpha/beta fold hydrolase, partial [Acidobacteriota bacterium]